MRKSVGGRQTFTLYLGIIIILLLVVSVAIIAAPIIARQQLAELQYIQATAAAAPSATTAALEEAYQRGLGYMNMARWPEAKAELEQVFKLDPNYKEVQAKLKEVEAEVAKTAPLTVTPILASGATDSLPINIVTNGDFEMTDINTKIITYTVGQSLAGWTIETGSVDLIGIDWGAASGEQSMDLSGLQAGSIYQELSTHPGQTYRLHFAIAGNPDSAPSVKQMEIWWGAVLVDRVTFDTTGHARQHMGWVHKDYMVKASSEHTSLKFRSLTEGMYGPALDYISVQ